MQLNQTTLSKFLFLVNKPGSPENGCTNWLILGSTDHFGALAPPLGSRRTFRSTIYRPDWLAKSCTSFHGTDSFELAMTLLTGQDWVCSWKWSSPDCSLPLSVVKILSSEALVIAVCVCVSLYCLFFSSTFVFVPLFHDSEAIFFADCFTHPLSSSHIWAASLVVLRIARCCPLHAQSRRQLLPLLCCSPLNHRIDIYSQKTTIKSCCQGTNLFRLKWLNLWAS